MLQIRFDCTMKCRPNEPELEQLIKARYIEDDTITLVTDGACSGNPGPGGYAGCMIYRTDSEQDFQVKFYQGRVEETTTNNKCEVIAIREGVKLLKKSKRLIIVTDSQYALGVLSGSWRVKSNQELVYGAKNTIMGYSRNISWQLIDGHGDWLIMKHIDRLAAQQAGSNGKH